VPMALHHGSMRWTAWGPLTFQTSRVLLYATFFGFGLALGASGLSRSALVAGSPLARRFWIWIPVAAVAFWASSAAAVKVFTTGMSARWLQLSALGYAAAAVAISFALLALFLRFAARPPADAATPPAPPLAAALADSLRRSAYGMFLFHYALVSWLQYALLHTPWSGAAKAGAVFVATVAATWLLTAGLRRVPGISRIL
jgi:surface polysaccharide O-acyltransferase-like enzyme